MAHILTVYKFKMDTIKISAKLKEVTYLVNAFIGKEPMNPETSISIGSGVAVSARGDLLTAAHVITGRMPIQQKDIDDPTVTIVARNTSGNFIQYYPSLFAPSLNNPAFKEPLTVDLALLRPVNDQSNTPHVRISIRPIEVGTRVLMAGFPDDMELPFSFDRILNNAYPEKKKAQSARQQLLMIKSGMVGHCNTAILSDGSKEVEVEMFHIDNQLHSGASGGPVVDQSGNLIGIITQRAITSVSSQENLSLEVPSGTTIALSPKVILPLLEEQSKVKP